MAGCRAVGERFGRKEGYREELGGLAIMKRCGGFAVKRKITAMVIAALAAALPAQAAGTPEFSLDQVLVTALREESKDLTTPAYVHVLTGEQLKATGATTVMEALKFREGFAYYSQNPLGHSNGSMCSRLVIRGVEKGTLVLLNGVPQNFNGWYQLDSIPLDNIERIEVVSGGGSVLYGSEAFGGVINIITKKTVANSFSTSFGSYGQQDHNLSLQVGKLAFNANYSELGTVRRITGVNGTNPATAYYTNYDGNERTNLSATYVFNTNLTMRYEHTQDYIRRSYHLNSNDGLRPTSTALMYDDDRKDVFTVLYRNKNLKLNAFYNRRELYDESRTAAGALTGNIYTDTVAVMGLDAQNSWQTRYGKLLVGTGFQRDGYQKEISFGTQTPVGAKSRNGYSLYVQQTRDFNPRDTLIVGARQQWVRAENDNNRSELLPQLQFLHRISDRRTWFVDINKSFRMPTFTELYVTNSMLTANPGLAPETGWSYETGWKFKFNDADLKIAVYYMDITDKIAYVSVSGTRTAQNFQKFRNLGLETRYERKLDKRFSYQLGASYSNPRQAGSDGVYSPVYNKLQLTGGLTFTANRWTIDLYGNYLAVRANKEKPMLPVTLAVSYKDKSSSVWTLTVDNLFDRRDMTTDSTVTATSPGYYAMPRSFRLAYSAKL
jgi:vitamin B12 transporter